MNTPQEAIRRAYAQRPEAQSFDWYLDWHIQHGFVHSTPAYFIMGFAVDSAALKAGALPMDAYRTPGDCWYVFAMAGDTKRAWEILPWELPFLAWHRDRDGGKDLHIHPLTQIRRLSGGI